MADKNHQEGFNPLDTSDPSDNLVNDYSDLMESEAYIGDTPYPTIVECIKTQFEDYINMQDTVNYVDVFYTQLHDSYAAVAEAEEPNQPEMIEALDRIRDDFIDTMKEQFATRLTITIMALENEDYDMEEIELCIRLLYEFFILDARKNFIQVIMTDVLSQIGTFTDEVAYHNKINSMMRNYSPLFSTLSPDQFLVLRGQADDIIQLYQEGKVVGNFLRKYSPKFYRNELFQVEVINEITLTYGFREEFKQTLANSAHVPKSIIFKQEESEDGEPTAATDDADQHPDSESV